MTNITPSKEALLLNNALNEADTKTELEHWDLTTIRTRTDLGRCACLQVL